MLAAEIQASAWELALAAVEEGLLDDQIPSLQRLGRLGQLGDMPTFIGELARELVDPRPERLRRGSPLAAQAREHARQREALRLRAARDRDRVPAPAARAVALRRRALGRARTGGDARGRARA